MALFKNQAASQPQSNQQKYAAACSNLLWVVLFSAINVVLRLVGADIYFLFSASMPLFFVELGAALAELLPALYVVGIVAALAGIGIYLVCYFMAKKHSGWMIAALVLFALDTVMMFLLYEISAEIILDVLFHAWVLYSLVVGVIAANKMKKEAAAAPVFPEGYAPAVAPEEIAPQPVMMVNGEPMAQQQTAQEDQQ